MISQGKKKKKKKKLVKDTLRHTHIVHTYSTDRTMCCRPDTGGQFLVSGILGCDWTSEKSLVSGGGCSEVCYVRGDLVCFPERQVVYLYF